MKKKKLFIITKENVLLLKKLFWMILIINLFVKTRIIKCYNSFLRLDKNIIDSNNISDNLYFITILLSLLFLLFLLLNLINKVFKIVSNLVIPILLFTSI